MGESKEFITGEFRRTIDDRFRLTLPGEFEKVFKPVDGHCVLVKEGSGCLSLWDELLWKQQQDKRFSMLKDKWDTGYLGKQIGDVQRVVRLFSTRHREVQLAKPARFMLPEGFREFLAVKEKEDVMVIGAGLCIEIWHPQKWINYVEQDIPQFGNLLETLLNS